MIVVCPGTLKAGFKTYSPACLKKVFDGKKVSHILGFDWTEDREDITDAVNRISISGVQEKFSACIKDGCISLTQAGESGRYIIKPVPAYRHLRFRNNIPANEHLTMQIASQVYRLNTADNALAFFHDGEQAYVTRRFDYAPDGSKLQQDDFASLAGKTAHTLGSDYKYTGSYEDIAALIRQYVATWKVQMTQFFSLVMFNYLFCNGDAHLKNFSLITSPGGDYVLAPAYDLMNTAVHVDDSDFALQDGLMPQSVRSGIYDRSAHPCKDDFITFGKRIGVLPGKINALVEMYAADHLLVYELIENSFLDDKVKRMYRRLYQERLNRFRRSEN